MSAPDDLIAGRYRLVRLVGRGGMGAVWEARDERLGRPVAVKQLHAPVGVPAADIELADQRAMREARIAARLQHPHAVGVFDVVEHEGRPCLVLQYLPSTPLSELIRRDGPMSPERVAAIGSQTSSALAAAHAVGIVHRDVKPGNILVTEDGSAVISDFGISHALGDVTLTGTGLVHGTPAFLAPEVARGAEAGPSSDVYSLGATLYTAVEGTPPFGTDSNAMALLHRIASGEPRPPERSGALRPLIARMLAADPADRPTMAGVVRAWRALAGGTEPGDPADPQTAATLAVGSDLSASTTPRRPAPPVPVGPPAVAPSPAPGPDRTVVSTSAAPVVGPTAVPTGPGPAPDATGNRRRRRGGPLVALVALAVVAAAVLGVWLVRRPGTPAAGGPAAQGGSVTSAGSSPTPRTGSSRSGSTSPSASASPSTGASGGSSSAGSATAAQLAAAITGYYASMPAGTDAGWQKLSPSYQRQAGGRTGYDRFWAQMASVTARGAVGNPPDQATATIVYVYRNGRTVADRTQFGLLATDGGLLIDSTRVLSSTTTTSAPTSGSASTTAPASRSTSTSTSTSASTSSSTTTRSAPAGGGTSPAGKQGGKADPPVKGKKAGKASGKAAAKASGKASGKARGRGAGNGPGHPKGHG